MPERTPARIPANKARQGRRGVQVLVVLVVGLALAGAVWLGLEFYGETIDTHSLEQPGAVEPDVVRSGAGQPGTTQPGQPATTQPHMTP